jgi:hypothetical protein
MSEITRAANPLMCIYDNGFRDGRRAGLEEAIKIVSDVTMGGNDPVDVSIIEIIREAMERK